MALILYYIYIYMYLARYVFLGRALNTILNQQTSRFHYDHNMK